MSEPFRSPTHAERQLIDRLLAESFDGNSELSRQAVSASVKTIDESGSLSFRIETSGRAGVRSRVPVEAHAADADGAPIHVLLHVVDERLSELELFREDLRIVQRFPSADGLTYVFVPYPSRGPNS